MTSRFSRPMVCLGRVEGRVEGRAEGKAEEKTDIARNLLDILNDETIALKTGLSQESVAKLRKEEKKS